MPDTIRDEIRAFGALGPLPAAGEADDQKLLQQQNLLARITKPISNDEARVLVKLFGPDDCYGLAWTLLHLIESAPGWPLKDCLENLENEWLIRLRDSAKRAGRL
ncbi:MAG: hypothetical protein HQM08_29165 [Candidatus Riflebacteria bacterium]|nr:hypothetical protein [Candidatus Riflebacteria bacterium]